MIWPLCILDQEWKNHLKLVLSSITSTWCNSKRFATFRKYHRKWQPRSGSVKGCSSVEISIIITSSTLASWRMLIYERENKWKYMKCKYCVQNGNLYMNLSTNNRWKVIGSPGDPEINLKIERAPVFFLD